MHKQNSTGFTIIEMSVVIIIVGLIIASVLPSIRAYQVTEDFYETRANLEFANDALREYFALQGRYPCPADPTVPLDDPDYGLEADLCDANNFIATSICPTGLVCTSAGTRDADGDTVNDDVLIGTLPVRAIEDAIRFAPFTFPNAKDAYANKITYAVTRNMAHTNLNLVNPANTQLGAINLLDEFSLDVTEPPGSAHYAIVSHGYNGRGAYSLDGNQVGDCDVNTIAAGLPSPPTPGDIDVANTPGIDLELENCDNDDGRFIVGLQSHVPGDDYYDDQILFNAQSAEALWRQSSINPNFLYNTNFGNVGIDVSDPADKLSVNGNLRAETSVVADGGFCDPADNDCLDPDAIGGTAMTQCPPGEVAMGIENNNLVCIPLFPSGVSFDCGAGAFVTGFTINGGVATPSCATP